MTSVAPFSLVSLPAVGAARSASLRLPWTWSGRLDRPVILGLSESGIIRLTWDGFQQGPTTSREELYLIDGEGRRGRVSIDRWLALNVVARTLGLPPPRSLRRLGPGEKGILAGHLAALLTFASGRLDVDLVGAPGDRWLEAAVGLAFQAEAAGACGPVRLDVPPQWLAAVADGWSDFPGPTLKQAMGRLETTARIELADTCLPLAIIAETGVGDTVVFDGERFRAADEEVPARIRVGDFESGGVVRADGAIVYLGPFALARRRDSGVRARAPAAAAVVEIGITMDSGASDRKMDVLAAAPVQVVAELGRLTLRGDEVLGLERGSVLAFSQRRGMVDLVVGGRTWARGELVNVDGELGVRISEMVHAWRAEGGAPRE
ncbi:MAG TPA: FliM/FliN family flagellar motor switch protein [Polyangia bacterium]|nr:FliM/FliN family flagellar motor switch protein [Polyangia bacterium]